MSTNHNFWRERRAEAVSNRGSSAYQPTALPLGQTGSLTGQTDDCGSYLSLGHFTAFHEMWKREHWSARKTCQPWRLWLQRILNNDTSAYCINAWCGARCHWLRTRPHDSGTDKSTKAAQSAGRCNVNNNNNVHLSCTHQRPERSHDTY